MKANEIPEKIYLTPLMLFAAPTISNNENDVEYVHIDAFIEKACEWLKNSSYGYLTENWGGIELDRETLVVDFANYMKGE